jgi:hypothetical protein
MEIFQFWEEELVYQDEDRDAQLGHPSTEQSNLDLSALKEVTLGVVS